ncbi:family 43 glycosylhydrolase [bacterium]|nr:family 43 glycosylhydrolase [bacterium]
MMPRLGWFVICIFILVLNGSTDTIPFERIASPIIFQGDAKFAYRDPAVVYHDETFYLYFTLSVNDSDGGYHNMTAFSKSRDLMYWSYPRIITPRDRELNFSSPGNVIRYKNEWILCLQTYPTPNKEKWGNPTARLWIMRSDDLEDWSTPELLKVKGPNVPRGKMGRMIDPYLIEDADEPGKWWCFYKQNGVSMSYSYDLETWTYVGRRDAGENVTVIRDDGEYVMFHSPSNGIGVKRSTDLSQWGGDMQLLPLGQEDWPWSQGRLTAATVVDLRGNPDIGKCIMFFHGSTKVGLKNQGAHGQASLAMAWSKDLVHWAWPGKE